MGDILGSPQQWLPQVAKESGSQEGSGAIGLEGKICVHASGRDAEGREKKISRAWSQGKLRSELAS